MNISILGWKGDFDSASGSGARRYISELYKNITSIASNLKAQNSIRISKLELPSFGTFPLFLANIFDTYGNFDIIHNARSDILCAPFKSTRTVTVNTAYEFLATTTPDLVMEDFTNIAKRVGVIGYWYLNKLAEQQMLKADYLIAISKLTCEDSVRFGYPRKRIYTVNLGIDKRFNKSIPSKHHKRFTAGYIGSYIKKKNILFAVNAFRQSTSKDVTFELWGKLMPTYYSKKIRNEAAADQRISFKGFAPEEKLVEIYDSFDVLLYPALCSGFEIGILEAQARGLPVIIYRNARLTDEVTKYCIKADDEAHMAQLMQQIKDNGYNQKLQKKAMAYARSFTWEKTASQTLKVYQDIQSRR